MKKMKQGFTLVEIMIVVAIIGLLAAIAIPSFMKNRQQSQKNSCINNLRLIEHAKEQWAMETGASTGSAVADKEAGVIAYIKGGAPKCPIGDVDSYTYNAVGTLPVCGNFDAATHAAAL